MSLTRLFRPRSLAVIGGGAWCRAAIDQARRFGFAGDLFSVHPNAPEVAGMPTVPRIEDLPAPPDAAFIGINRDASVQAVRVLSDMGAGGAVCFASGFTEAAAEDASGVTLQAELVRAAGDMPILGPNCYGFINAFDGALLWPDQHGCARRDRGVAILTQSSNIAINLTMQRRALPIGYVVTCGNMAQTSQAAIAGALLDDPRVTAIGLHVEGFSDLHGWHALARKAWDRGVPLVALKVGRSDHARRATVSHTASLAGEDAGAQAFLDRLGIPRVSDLSTFLEALKILHAGGPLSSNRIATISCSGGEASLAADTAMGRDLDLPPLTKAQKTGLSEALGPRVALANPLDYHTYIWRDTDTMTRAWSAMATADLGLTMSIVDYPHTDASDWNCATQAAIRTAQDTGARFAVAATLPELMPPDVAQRLLDAGVIPLNGLAEAMAAVEAAACVRESAQTPALPPQDPGALHTLTEDDAKQALAAYGVIVPRGGRAEDAAHATDLAKGLNGPFALKTLGLAHKTEAGAVRLNLPDAEAVRAAAQDMPAGPLLVEEMASGGVAEILIGVAQDPAHGYVLTLGAGGVLAELLNDTVSLLVPANRRSVREALGRLRCWPLLTGYRGAPGADLDALLDTVMAVQSYVLEHAATLGEVEINPLICTPTSAIAVDALIRKARA